MPDEGDKVCLVNVQHVRITYPFDELIRHSPDKTAFGHATKDRTHPKVMEDLHWSLNQKVLPDHKDNVAGSSQVKNNGKDDQTKLTCLIAQYMLILAQTCNTIKQVLYIYTYIYIYKLFCLIVLNVTLVHN